jgi:transcriptional regulator with XRE-family HTH domain
MKISISLTDTAVLRELGERITQQRIARNLTQAALAEQSGIAKRTLERIENGSAAQTVSLIRVLRVLELLPNLELLLPPAEPGPVDQLQRRGKRRQRASGKRGGPDGKTWQWADDT